MSKQIKGREGLSYIRGTPTSKTHKTSDDCPKELLEDTRKGTLRITVPRDLSNPFFVLQKIFLFCKEYVPLSFFTNYSLFVKVLTIHGHCDRRYEIT